MLTAPAALLVRYTHTHTEALLAVRDILDGAVIIDPGQALVYYIAPEHNRRKTGAQTIPRRDRGHDKGHELPVQE